LVAYRYSSGGNNPCHRCSLLHHIGSRSVPPVPLVGPPKLQPRARLLLARIAFRHRPRCSSRFLATSLPGPEALARVPCPRKEFPGPSLACGWHWSRPLQECHLEHPRLAARLKNCPRCQTAIHRTPPVVARWECC